MSAPPTVGSATETVYAGLPELYRDADAAQADGDSNYPLLRFLSLVLDQLTPLLEVLDRLTYTAPDEAFNQPIEDTGDVLSVPVWPTVVDTSDLVDPDTADGAWLPWLAQIVGVNYAGLTPTQLRARLHALDVWQRHGSAVVLIALVREALGLDPLDGIEDGDQFVTIGEYGGPNEYDEAFQNFVICLHYTNAGEAGNEAEDAVVLAHVEQERPAGFVLTLGDI